MNDSEWEAFWNDLIEHCETWNKSEDIIYTNRLVGIRPGQLKDWLPYMKDMWETYGHFKLA